MPGLSGTSLGHYRLGERLGRGGMSEVYLAIDEQMSREVAVKIVSSSHAEYVVRFRREAEAIHKLHHAHILPALDYGEQEPWHYLVMPYIAHGTLRDLLTRGSLSQEEAGLFLEQLAGALQFAHERGIIHRDIKPSNILLRDDHYAYLADFGLAKSMQAGDTITQVGSLMGTPEYMAPELSEGPAGVSSDLYALGIVLYQMVTGELPFTADTPIMVYMKQLQDQPTRPSQVNHNISPAVEQVILRALQKNPLRRYQNASDLAQAYIQALTFPEQVDTLEEPSSLYETTPISVEMAAIAEIQVPTHESEGVLPHTLPVPHTPQPLHTSPFPTRPSDALYSRESGVDGLNKTPPMPLQRRRVFRRRALSPNVARLRPARPSDYDPNDETERIPTTSQWTPPLASPVSAPPPTTPVQSQQAPHIPRRRRQSLRRRNPILLSMSVVLVLLAIIALIAVALTNQYNQITAQNRNGTATADINATSSVQAANVQTTQQAQVAATAGDLQTATSKSAILSDTLADNSSGNWTVSATCNFTGGSYHVYVQQTDFLQICPSSTLAIGNATIQVDVSLLSGNDAGLIFRTSADQFYDFEITNQGMFYLRRHNSTGSSGNYTYLIPNRVSSAISPGAQKNTLLVIANGNDFKLYINNTFVGEAHDSAYVSGQIGFVVGTLSSTGKGEASFANLKVFGQ